MAQKRRVLEKLKLTEISGVDRPAQESAHVAIMKRKDDTMDDQTPIEGIAELEGAVLDLEAQVADLTKRLAEADAKLKIDPFKRLGSVDFEQTVTEIRKRDNCTRTEALSKARRENPEGFEEFQGVEAEADTPAIIAKAGKTPFEHLVDQIMSDEKVTRSVAMSRARKKEPAMFGHYQEA